MPLPMPRLDNRTFDQLVNEGRSLLPRLAPGWTDFNYHDPGITLIDLLAWLVEMDMYRLDRTTEAAYRAFLRLVGIEPRPPQIAETVLAFGVQAGGPSVTLGAGKLVGDSAATITFQTARDLVVSTAQLTSVLAGSEGSLVDCTAQNQAPGKRFAPLGNDPRPGQALYLGFDAPPAPANTEVSVYVWVNSPEDDRQLRQALIEERLAQQARRQGCRTPAAIDRLSEQQHYSVTTQWEFYAGSNLWSPLSNVTDETRGLTLNGALRFVLPADSLPAPDAVSTKPGQRFIRCRLVSGYYECPPEIQAIALNAVLARHAVDVAAPEVLGTSSGHAAQSFALQHPPVAAGSTQLQVAGDPAAWHETLNWDRVGPHDRSYLLVPETGQIVFGDGRYGRVPTADARIRVTHYHAGGGARGNVGAGTLTRYLGAEKVAVKQPFAAAGGADTESLDDAKGRAIAWLSELRRAVTLSDFEQIALATPGVPVARVQALADYDPTLSCVPALGSITVVVVPGCANPIPEPGPDMLRAVEQYLCHRQTVTTELHVIGPNFVTVAVQATLHTGPNVTTDKVIAAARSRLDTFLHPLQGGAGGQGWPIGRDVYRSEVMALLNAVPGVVYVDEVSLQVESELDVYEGYVTWRQVFDRGGTPTPVQAELRIEPERVAHRVVAEARSELDEYFKSSSGRSRHKTDSARLSDVMMILRAVPGVVSVERLRLDGASGSGITCENVSLCAHSLILPGDHALTVSGARTSKPIRANPPVC